MPSPFPGMDPFVEGQRGRDFHHGLIAVIQQRLVPSVRPKYAVDVEEYVYVVKSDDEVKPVAPDVSVTRPETWDDAPLGAGPGTLTALRPVVRTLPKVVRIRQAFLVIRTLDDETVITALEVLSPWNKSGGRQEYLNKRDNVLASTANLVEIDLLRGGQRLPTVEPLPSGDYFVFVSRPERRPEIDVFAWPLRAPLPTIPVPLADGDPDVPLDLQSLFTDVYDRAGYDYALHYDRPIQRTLDAAEAVWVNQVLRRSGES